MGGDFLLEVLDLVVGMYENTRESWPKSSRVKRWLVRKVVSG